MIKAKNSNGEYVDIEDIKTENIDIEYIKDNLGNVLYSKYKEIETGTLPVNFTSKNDTLKNYRIYGNTVNGDSVGDRTANLFDFRKWSINVEANTGNDIIKNIDGITLVANISDAFTTPYVYTHTNFYKINVKPNTTYVLSWSSNNNLPGWVFVFKNGIDDVTHRISVNNKENKYLLFDTDMDTEFVTLRFGVNNAGDSITYSKIMFVEGDTVLPYEPYGYRVPLTAEGKNLFDKSKPANILKCYLSISTLVSSADTRSVFIECKPNTTYTVSKIRGNRFVVGWSDKLPVPGVEVQDKVINYTANSITITTGLAAKYLVAYVYNVEQDAPITVDDMIASVQIEKGSTATPYEPYHPPVTTNIYLPEPIKMVGDEAEYIDFKKQKQYRIRKNLVNITSSNYEIRNYGITWTINEDNSVTANGSTQSTFALFLVKLYLKQGSYIINGCPENGGQNTYRCEIRDTGLSSISQDVGSGATINIASDGFYYYSIRIAFSYICDNLTFYPMIRKSGIEDDTYEPYIEDTELDTTLPVLPIFSGTNILSVGTTVQPSKIYLKGKNLLFDIQAGKMFSN